MNCVAPPELDGIALLQAIDGNASPETLEHLRQCEYCRDRLESVRRQQGGLSRLLFRVDCPTPEALSDHVAGVLVGSGSQEVSGHIAGCPYCLAEMELIGAADLEQLPPEKRLSVRVLPRRTVGSGSLGGAELAIRPTRSGTHDTSAKPAVFAAEGIQVSLKTERDPSSRGRLVLYGLVVDDAPMSEWTVILVREQRIQRRVVLDDRGNFVIDAVEQGEYELVISGPALELLVEQFRIEG